MAGFYENVFTILLFCMLLVISWPHIFLNSLWFYPITFWQLLRWWYNFSFLMYQYFTNDIKIIVLIWLINMFHYVKPTVPQDLAIREHHYKIPFSSSLLPPLSLSVSFALLASSLWSFNIQVPQRNLWFLSILEIIMSHIFNYYLYAEDLHIYISVPPLSKAPRMFI